MKYFSSEEVTTLRVTTLEQYELGLKFGDNFQNIPLMLLLKYNHAGNSFKTVVIEMYLASMLIHSSISRHV